MSNALVNVESFSKLKSSGIASRASGGSASDPPAWRLARLREAPASVRRVRLAGAAGARLRRGRRGSDHDNCADVFAVLQLARSPLRAPGGSGGRVLHFEQSPLSGSPSCSHSRRGSSRLAAPAAVLLPADDFNVRSQRPPEHKSFYGNFIPNAPRPLAREQRQYKSTITNGRVN